MGQPDCLAPEIFTHTHNMRRPVFGQETYEGHHVNEGKASVPGFTESVIWLQPTMSSVSTEVS